MSNDLLPLNCLYTRHEINDRLLKRTVLNTQVLDTLAIVDIVDTAFWEAVRTEALRELHRDVLRAIGEMFAEDLRELLVSEAAAYNQEALVRWFGFFLS